MCAHWISIKVIFIQVNTLFGENVTGRRGEGLELEFGVCEALGSLPRDFTKELSPQP